MKERPILFSAPMVRAILDGTKTQTRRVVKPQPVLRRDLSVSDNELAWQLSPGSFIICPNTRAPEDFEKRSPYGQPGGRLWVRETFCPIYPQDPTYNGGEPIEYDYAATYKHGDRLGDSLGIKKVWKPSIHMPRAACRIVLEVTGVRVERLQDISEADAIAEGIERSGECNWCDYLDYGYNDFTNARYSYRTLWESINGAGSWNANPWVWVIEFKRVDAGAMKQAA
ncbi:hypothetical protein [Noviherbaspirillum autotrophicum]|uniref:Morphogenetic protein n=1 Tax=Noviherbaspirillum autotrophicum TaxID=709839 RepID=A0A0C2C164_9BURK|nr:hypothetical protein [Noviherbaspirillum autotrophicum]KIF80798.1 hypothetical protein TSA66_08150 [Noviherbaspirillum autotrophicum]KIF80836.1 hypothetical protein TSA66_08395 [Noviherbaspirillum autotrophicum]KIF84061.1 hypothetical protein TSA66_01085 [Noviherbaspirillum autotrophicum]